MCATTGRAAKKNVYAYSYYRAWIMTRRPPNFDPPSRIKPSAILSCLNRFTVPVQPLFARELGGGCSPEYRRCRAAFRPLLQSPWPVESA
jgi:hypothetical protein